LNEAVSVVKFVKYRHALAGKYAELQGPMSVSKTLAMPVATRWCSQHTCVRNLLDAKAIIIAISNTASLMDAIKGNQLEKKEKFVESVTRPSFWAELKVWTCKSTKTLASLRRALNSLHYNQGYGV